MSGFELQVRTTNEAKFSDRVIARARTMLRAMLEKAEVRGVWIYRITGFGHFVEQSRYRMQAETGSVTASDMLYVKIRASLILEGTISGMLQFPKDEQMKTSLLSRLQSAIEALNYVNWKEVVESETRQSMKAGDVPVIRQVWATVEGDARRNPPRSMRLASIDGKSYQQSPTALSEGKEQLMKVTQKASNGFTVSITKGRDHGTQVPPLAADMLHEALARTGVTKGVYSYQVTGTYSQFLSHSRHVMSVVPGRDRAIRVNMKCAKSRESTVTGLLYVPHDVDYQYFYGALGKSAEALNNEQWASLWKRQGAETGEQADKDQGLSLGINNSSVSKETAPTLSSPATPLISDPVPVVAALPATSVTEDGPYIALLIKIVNVVKNGVFTGEQASPLVYASFPERSTHGLLMGTMWKLERLGFTRRVESKERATWQVRESFLHSQGLDMKLESLPSFKRKATPRLSKKQPDKAVAPGKKEIQRPVDNKQAPKPHSGKPKSEQQVKLAMEATSSSAPLPVAGEQILQSQLQFLKELKTRQTKLLAELDAVAKQIKSLEQSFTREQLLELLLGK